jgi:hypothetical protein
LGSVGVELVVVELGELLGKGVEVDGHGVIYRAFCMEGALSFSLFEFVSVLKISLF